MGNTSSPQESLASILTIEPVRDGEFVARLEDFWGAPLGGDIFARAALAAADSCAGKELHSLHACLLRPVPAATPLRLLVERLDDSPRLARRQVRLLGDELFCQVVASFVAPGEGLGYQDIAIEPGLPRPEDMRSTLETARAEGWTDYARGPVEFRRVEPVAWPDDPSAGKSGTHIEWVQPRTPLPDDPRLHMAAVVFVSEFYSHWPFGRRVDRFANDQFKPLDHALWVHRTVRWDDWLLLKATTEVGHAGRGLARRELFTRDGLLVASSAHEALVGKRA